ncbi:MAG TPA: hypothetical protein VGB65_07630 [Allosphingosinicella sp.]|jgi:hypothetical protein
MNDADLVGEERGAGLFLKAWRLACVAASSIVLLYALRFGGRTYPGWYFPNSDVLNALLNGVGLFTGWGYSFVLAGAGAATLRILLGGTARRGLKFLQWLAFTLAILIILYGAAWATYTQRLPWQQDGQGRYPPLI